jgi:hypothetical protein
MEPRLLATKLTCRGVPPPTGTTITLLNASVSPPYASQRLSGDHAGGAVTPVARRTSLPDRQSRTRSSRSSLTRRV